MPKRVGLRAKFILSISLILLVVFGLVGFFLIRNVRSSLTNELNRDTVAFATLATQSIGNSYEIYKDSGTLRIDQQIGQYTGLDGNITNVSVVDVSGQTLFSLHASGIVKASSAEASSFDPIYRRNGAGQITAAIQPYASTVTR